MSILDEVRSIASTIQKIDNIELYRQILNLQGEVTELVAQEQELDRENRDLRAKLQLHGELRYERNAYWRPYPDSQQIDGPFCSNCWDTKQRLVRMHEKPTSDFAECSTCQSR